MFSVVDCQRRARLKENQNVIVAGIEVKRPDAAQKTVNRNAAPVDTMNEFERQQVANPAPKLPRLKVIVLHAVPL
jgi:hypothetical protein